MTTKQEIQSTQQPTAGVEANIETKPSIMTVNAMHGKMAGVDYYVVTMPYSFVSRFLTVADVNLPAKQRENRLPSPRRYREISAYIQENPTTYRFSSLTCCYGRPGTHAPLKVEPLTKDGKFVQLTLDSSDPFLVVDGQHRLGGIQHAIAASPELGSEEISVVLFPYIDLEHAQQLFSDLNRTAKKTSKSLDILFDHRDLINAVADVLIEDSGVLNGRVAPLCSRADMLIDLPAVYQAIKPVVKTAAAAGLIAEPLSTENQAAYVKLLSTIFDVIAEAIPEWNPDSEIPVAEMRSKYLHWNSGVVSVIGDFIADVMAVKKGEWASTISKTLKEVKWERNNPMWQGIATAGSQVLGRSALRTPLRAYLKQVAGLELTAGETEALAKATPQKKVKKAA